MSPKKSSPRRMSVSTYSVSRTLGVTYADSPTNQTRERRERSDSPSSGTVSLLEVPARLADMNIHTLEISHPHLPSREPAYLDELRAALDEARVQLFSVLIEDGDITNPDMAARDLAWMEGWIETAGRLGAERARVIAGKAAYTPVALQQSFRGLQQLVARGEDCGVRITTENWFDLLASPPAVIGLMDALEGTVGLNLDYGNWEGPDKYTSLAEIFPYAESCHAKCAFVGPYTPDAEDFQRCLELGRDAHFSGPFTLIYNAACEDEWRGLAIERDLVAPYLSD